MCGIATLAFGRGLRDKIPYPSVRSLCKRLLVELQPRGMDATGIAVINEGAESKVFKKPLRADRMVVRPMFDAVLSAIGPKTNFVMLHVRAATAGSTGNNFNNHPIITEPIVGIHNGTLINDLSLFSSFEKFFEQEGDVDSEIIFKLYHHFTKLGLSPQEAMSRVGEILRGTFTGALVDLRNPAQMVMFKNERSLSVIRIPRYDVVLTVSEAFYYDRAARQLKLQAKDQREIVSDGTGLLFDLNSEKRITEELHDFDIPVTRTAYSSHNNWVSSLG